MSFQALLLVLLAACNTNPLNGTTFDDATVVGKLITFTGYTDHPNETVRLQVLRDATVDPKIDTNWDALATAVTVTSPTVVNSSSPLYAWTVAAKPVPTTAFQARWSDGGLVRVRATRTDSSGTRILATFDQETFSACFSQHLSAGEDWMTIGQACNGTGNGTATLVSTTKPPLALPGDATTNRGFLGKKGKNNATSIYYALTFAPPDLGSFIMTFGFPSNEVVAQYYNDGDLGIGREMHCRIHLFQPPYGAGLGLVCYVKNYHANGLFGDADDVDETLSNTIHGSGAFATVAMTFNPSAPQPVTFAVYDDAGNLKTDAALDNGFGGVVNNASVPNNCMSCHGISSSFVGGVVKNAKFLPFDPFSFIFSKQVGYTFNDQADNIRKLNSMIVNFTSPTAATQELVNGMYAPLGVNNPSAVANNTFVPTDWKTTNTLDGDALYSGFIKVGCRTCHVSSTNPALDFTKIADFEKVIATVQSDVCDPNLRSMPHAQHTMKKFWQSGARAYLTSRYGFAAYPDAREACNP